MTLLDLNTVEGAAAAVVSIGAVVLAFILRRQATDLREAKRQRDDDLHRI